MTTLIIDCEGTPPARVELAPGEYSLGTADTNSIVIQHPTVSRHHCDIMVDTDGQVIVRDAGSTNGTWLASESVSHAVLAPGQTFQVGVARITMDPPPAKRFIPRVPAAPPAATVATAPSSPVPNTVVEPRTFLQELPDACRYPLRGDAFLYIFIVLLMELVQMVLPNILGILSLFINIVIGCYLVLLWQQIIQSTIDGKDQLPNMPFASLDWHENLGLYLRYIVLICVCFSPVILFHINAAMNENTPGLLLYVCYGISCLYFPMVILAFLITDSLAVLSPVFIIRSILRNLPDYLVLAGLLALGIAADSLTSILYEPSHSRLFLWAVILISEAIGLYLFFVWMRLVGLFYRRNQDRLAWV
jgi:hypothetical protein